MARAGFIDMEYFWKEKGGKYISLIEKASNKNSQLLRELLKRKG